MIPQANPGKSPAIVAEGRTYLRLPLRTHFVEIGEDYRQMIPRYAASQCRPGDVLCISEKIIALCQRRVVFRSVIQPGFLAKLLCRFVHRSPAGPGAGTPFKMQLLIMLCGTWRVLLAAFCAALTKPLGIRGVFYALCGHGAGAIDGLIAQDISFAAYDGYAILSPACPNEVCRQMSALLGIPCALVDACDLAVEVLGHSGNLPFSPKLLKTILQDNPAGQGNQQTPLILVRPLGE